MTDSAVTDPAGPAALPRRNGELVFEAPWEGRAFGIAVALTEAGTYDWDEFRQQLIAQIDAAEEDDGSRYYERWLASLEDVLLEQGVLSAAELDARASELAASDEHEHDHDHGDHGHHHASHAHDHATAERGNP